MAELTSIHPYRRRLPGRRIAHTFDLEFNGAALTATIGFDITGKAAEVFLSGAKDGTDLAVIMDDASVVISIALQHGISAAALAKSIARAPDERGNVRAASVIGATLDLLVECEKTPFGMEEST